MARDPARISPQGAGSVGSRPLGMITMVLSAGIGRSARGVDVARATGQPGYTTGSCPGGYGHVSWVNGAV